MATLSKHGHELLRLDYVTCSVSYRSDGKILRNDGSGWKLYKRTKPGVDPMQHANTVCENRQRKDEACPVFAKFRKILAGYGVSTRRMIHDTLELMPGDPDGVWSTCDDYGKRVDLEDMVELSRLYDTAQAELKAYNERIRAQQKAAKKIGEPGLPNFNLNKP